MKKLMIYLTLALVTMGAVFTVTSCSKDDVKEDLTIGGKTDFAENKVGSKKSGIIALDGSDVGMTSESVVTENKDGIITVKFKIFVPNDMKKRVSDLAEKYFGDELAKYLIYWNDAEGTFNPIFRFKNSTEGFAFVNPDGSQTVVMKYDAKVGDKWTGTLINGKKGTFKTTYRSDTDDYDYAFFKIKVVKIESTANEPGLTKVVYIGNHKFGLVGMEYHLEDGTVTKVIVI